ncbi:MAG: hypothetical protein N2235_26050, partial [Fischerella sp.]|nr:hypothetical protein [Fischerella sp.]
GVVLDLNTGKKHSVFSYPDINDVVLAAAPDGNGGWYIGGNFTRVGRKSRMRLAHLAANGEVLPWAPVVNGTVREILVHQGLIYIGGSFTSVNGQPRYRLAAIQPNGELSAWQPSADNQVKTLAASNNVIFVGGAFTTLNGESRNRLAAVTTTGSLLSWNPNLNGEVNDIAFKDNILFAGGNFSQVSGQSRANLVAIKTDGSCLENYIISCLGQWQPSIDNPVNTVAIANETVFVGGDFLSVDGTTRSYFAAISYGILSGTDCLNNYATNPCLVATPPAFDNSVIDLSIYNNVIFAAGVFENYSSENRRYLAALNFNGALLSWNPQASHQVRRVVATGDGIFAGGYFKTIDAQSRKYLAAISTSGVLTSWNPQADNSVLALAYSQGTIFAAGEFTCLGNCVSGIEGVSKWSRNYLAAIGMDGTIYNWNPNVSWSVPVVTALAVSKDIVFAGGGFTTIGGQTRNRLAAIKADTLCLNTYSTPS